MRGMDDEAVPVPPMPELTIDSLPNRQVCSLVGEIAAARPINRWPRDASRESLLRHAQQLPQEIRAALHPLPEASEEVEAFALIDYLDELAAIMPTVPDPRGWYLDAVDRLRDQVNAWVELTMRADEAAALNRFLQDHAFETDQDGPGPQALAT